MAYVSNTDARMFIEALTKLKRIYHQPSSLLHGVNSGEFFLLCSVSCICDSGGPGAKMSDLGKRHDISPSAISQMIRTLEGKGLVKRCPSEMDRRVVYVSTTAKGAAILDEVNKRMLKSTENILNALTSQEISTLFRLLDKLCVAIDEARASMPGREQR
ncbi:MAG: MarR family winged helix-turn-helix transcriptional regulator [Christensenellaceae bacterium]|jgi:DNA-binding MarR family transcriptional regulator